MNLGIEHLHARLHENGGDAEPFPSRDFRLWMLDHIMYAIGIIQPFALIPQMYAVYWQGQTAGISIPTWSILAVFNIFWIIYASVHKVQPIFISSVLFAVFDILIILGVLYY